MRTAVVGHVEVVDFAAVERVPRSGEIVHATDSWRQPGGGGAGAAVQLAKLSGDCTFFTAVGDDEPGSRALVELESLGVRVEAAIRPQPTRRAFTHVDASGERSITVLGERLAPSIEDDLPWDELEDVDAVYFTAGDVGAVAAARKASVLVATSRALPVLVEAGVALDALVGSALDPGEAYHQGALQPSPKLVVRTEGDAGGSFQTAGGSARRYDAAPLLAPIVDRYGAGDSFAAGLAFSLGRGDAASEAIGFAARCGAAVVTGRGPYDGQLDRDALETPKT